MINRNHFWPGAVLILFVFLNAFGCENTFEPLQENDQYKFTLYGSVDLHADTQWLRVMPIGESLVPTDPESYGTEVVLIRERTGDSTALNDSLFVFGSNTFAWNYHTTEVLHPNEEYTVVATAPDGGQSRATVTVPSVLPVPEIDYNYERDGETGIIEGTNADPFVTLEMRYWVQRGCGASETFLTISHLDDIRTFPDGEYRVIIDNDHTINQELTGSIFGNFRVNHRELFMVTAREEEWPDFSVLTDEEIVLPEVVSNVENGTGLVAGIASRRIEISPRRAPC